MVIVVEKRRQAALWSRFRGFTPATHLEMEISPGKGSSLVFWAFEV
jgi:hypothetical protein